MHRPAQLWEGTAMIRVAFAVFGIVILLLIAGAGVVLLVAARVPEGFEDEQGYHSGAAPPGHPSV
jgi:hypothetical protein